MPRKYSKKSQEFVKEAMEEFKKGELVSGKSGKRVKNPKQAVAIGLSQARQAGEKVPPPPPEDDNQYSTSQESKPKKRGRPRKK